LCLKTGTKLKDELKPLPGKGYRYPRWDENRQCGVKAGYVGRKMKAGNENRQNLDSVFGRIA